MKLKSLIIFVALLTLWSKQCFSQFGSFIYKSPDNADAFLNDFEISKDSIIYFTLNRDCVKDECREIVKRNHSKVTNITTKKLIGFDPILINEEKVILTSYTSNKDNNFDSNYWHIDFYYENLNLIKTQSWKSPDSFQGLNYGIYNYKKENYLLYGSSNHANYPYVSPTIMIVNKNGEIVMPMTAFPYDTLNPQINNLEGVFMQYDTAFYFSYQIAKQPIYSQFYYKLKDDGTAILAYKTDYATDTRPLRFFVDDNNNLISFRRGTLSKSVVVFKIDKSGKELWNKLLPMKFVHPKHSVVNDIIPCKNGDILLASLAELIDTLPSGEIYQNPMIYLARLTKDGELKWIRRLSQLGTDGKWKRSSANKTVEADNGNILIGGALSREEAIGGYDAWFMRLSANGCLTDECKDEYVTEIGGDVITSTHDVQIVIAKSITLHTAPNPTSDKVIIDLPPSNINLYHYEIINSQGQKLEQSSRYLSNKQLDIDLSRYESGMYHILIKGDKAKEIYVVKVVKM